MIAQSRVATEAIRPVSLRSFLPSLLTGIENVGVAPERPVGEIGLAKVLPDVLRGVEFRVDRRQRHHGEVFRDLEFARGVPTSLVEDDHGVCAGAPAVHLARCRMHRFRANDYMRWLFSEQGTKNSSRHAVLPICHP
jgi:hypothetical protein